MNSHELLIRQFEQIDSLLTNTRQYWQILPFEYLEFPWQKEPQLCQFLSQLTLDEIESLDGCDIRLRKIIGHELDRSLDVALPVSVYNAKAKKMFDVPSQFKAGIKGRKWQQIEMFCSHIPMQQLPILEWCAGKGHLGRFLGYCHQRDVMSLEWQQSLCDEGQRLAEKHHVPQRFIRRDVFSSNDNTLLATRQHAVALHACGDLHTSLMKQACDAKTEQLTVAPCCYHLIQSHEYQPLSELAIKSQLQLSKQDLSLSIAQTVVASSRARKHRATEVAWRLGFDLLQREIRGENSYLPLPSIKQSMLTGTFNDFCAWACERKSLNLASDIDLTVYERKGWARRHTNAQIEIVTHAFRKLLEYWLILDRALFLAERGYSVSLHEFCSKEVTPRNTLINARRDSAKF